MNNKFSFIKVTIYYSLRFVTNFDISIDKYLTFKIAKVKYVGATRQTIRVTWQSSRKSNFSCDNTTWKRCCQISSSMVRFKIRLLEDFFKKYNLEKTDIMELLN
jgi:hypothetical protein